MKILTKASDLKQLYQELLKKTSVKNEVDVLGTLHSTIRGLWRYEAVVDNWPDFGALVLRPLQLVPRQSKYQEVYVLGETESLKGLLYEKCLPWHECISFRACPLIHKPVLLEAAKYHKGTLLDVDRDYRRFVEKDEAPAIDLTLPEGFVVKQMSDEDAPVVQKHWNKFAVEENHCVSSLETIEHLIQKSVTCCMYSPDGKPISWIILHHSGAGLCGYTVPEYRGKRFSHIVSGIYLKMAKQFGQPHLHGISAVGNKKVYSLNIAYGKATPELVTFYHYTPNVKANI